MQHSPAGEKLNLFRGSIRIFNFLIGILETTTECSSKIDFFQQSFYKHFRHWCVISVNDVKCAKIPDSNLCHLKNWIEGNIWQHMKNH